MNQTRPVPAFGVISHPQFPPKRLADYARRAEAAGFDELWLWDDCFLPGAFSAAAIALAATQHLKVGIGLLPATAYNPLFATMEITTLACAYPGRILPGFGHGVGSWMKQIGAAPNSSMKALRETVSAVRALLSGEIGRAHV
jgi:5,10-methylenetetrahydromethanopterin reductase